MAVVVAAGVPQEQPVAGTQAWVHHSFPQASTNLKSQELSRE